MNVLYMSTFYKPATTYGGPVRSVSLLCESLKRAGVDVVVYTTNANGARRLPVAPGEVVEIAGVPVRYFNLDHDAYFFSSGLARAVRLDARKFDLVVADSLFAHGLGSAASACRRAAVPYVIPPRGQLNRTALSRKSLKKMMYLECFGRRWLDRAAGIHCTDVEEERAVRDLGIKGRTFVVPNPIDMSRFEESIDRSLGRARLGGIAGETVFLFLGRLHPIKRPMWAVEAVGRMNAAGEKVRLVMAGPDEGQMAGALRMRAGDLGLAERFGWLGEVTDEEVPLLLSGADALLMPSESENFGLAAAEALAMGLPVAATAGVPVGRQASEVGAGFLCVDDLESFCQMVREVARNRSRLSEMGTLGRRLVRERFEAGAVASQMISQFQLCVKGNG
jgi:glycosyltransferase involved in cell wall biosynthesis